MTRHSFLRIMMLAMAWVSALGIANAIPVTCDVTLEGTSANEVTLVSAAVAPKGKEAETLAVKQAFFALIDRGVEGLHAGMPMLAEPSKEFNYTFYKNGKYLSSLVGSPLKLDESKVGSERRVRVRVTVNVTKLKADLRQAKLTISPAWQDRTEAPAALLDPTIVVVPYMPSGEDDSFEGMKAYIDRDAAMKHAVSAVSSQFSSHGYRTRDFMTMAANAATDDIMLEGTQTDAATMVIQQLPGDIVVTVDYDLATEGRNGQCTVTVNAVERQTAARLCSTTFSSGQFMTTDPIFLTDYALKKMEGPFFSGLQDAFRRIVDQGREIKLEFLLGEGVDDWDFDTETPASETNFKEALEEWLRERAHRSAYDMSQHNDKFIALSVNIPLWNSVRNRSYTPGDFNSDLRRFLREQLGDAYQTRISAMGQKLIITVE